MVLVELWTTYYETKIFRIGAGTICMVKSIACLLITAFGSFIGCVQQPVTKTALHDLVASDIQSADVDFEMESGSFLLKYLMRDGTKRTIVLECPKIPDAPTDKAPRILLRVDSSIGSQQVLSEQDLQSFIRTRLVNNDVSNEEAGFIAVAVLSIHRVADIRGWGFSSASIMSGEWHKVFLEPESGLSGPARRTASP